MAQISKKVLEKIEEENIRPYPKQYFILKRSVVWILFAISVLLGSISNGLIIYYLEHAEWELFPHFRHNPLTFLLMIVPLVWVVFFSGFAFLIYFYFRRTKKGYRYSTFLVISASLILSLLGGIFFQQIGLVKKVDAYFAKTVSFYRGVQDRKIDIWTSPERGLLAGKIIEILPDAKLRLKDFKGHIWEIDISQTIWRGRLRPQKNLEIKLLGHLIGKSRFKADEIRRWMGRGKRYRNQRHSRF